MEETMKVQVEQDETAFGVTAGKKVIEPPSTRNRWTASRLIVNEDGSTESVLERLAVLAFGDEYDPKKQFAVWKDKQWFNERVSNVQLITRSVERQKPQCPYPAGTPAYYRWYRARNKEKIREHQRNHRAKVRAKLEEMKAQNAAMQKVMQEDPAVAEKLEDALSDILGRPVERRDADIGPPTDLLDRRHQ